MAIEKTKSDEMTRQMEEIWKENYEFDYMEKKKRREHFKKKLEEKKEDLGI